MGCDIHLAVEKRRRNAFADERWQGVSIFGEFSHRIYGMFARMAIVRDYGFDTRVMFEPRGLPKDISRSSEGIFYMMVTDNDEAIEWGRGYCSKKTAERWVEQGRSVWVDDEHHTLTDPDHHSHSWLTTQELRQCFDDCFKNDDGTYKEIADFADYLGLVSLCEGIESSGLYECRVVFAFDN